MHLADGQFGVYQLLEGGPAEGNEKEGFHRRYLSDEIGVAGVNFGRKRGAVAWRAAFDEVSDEDLLATEADVTKEFVEELAGGTDEGAPLQILLLAGTFADEHDLGVNRTLAGDGVGAPLPEGALLATANDVMNLLQEHFSVPSACAVLWRRTPYSLKATDSPAATG